MIFAGEYYQLAHQVIDSIDIPLVIGIHLPVLVEDAQKADEFGFVFLQDGSAGPFYTSLEDSLHELWRLYPDGSSLNCNISELIEYFQGNSHVRRAVALGAFNAMSQHVMKRAGFSPLDTAGNKDIKANQPQQGQKVAIVGYIRPMVERLLAKGIEVMVLELNPARVDLQPGLLLSTDPADLLKYDSIICTASTLINDSLGDILQYKHESAQLSLIGPSGSGLPDVLFSHGVDDVGGFHFDDMGALHEALDKQESWGHAGEKYQLRVENYPGVDKLLETIHKQL